VNTKGYSRLAVAAVALLVAAGCEQVEQSGAGGNAGTAGSTFDVTVNRPTGGTVRSADGRIVCGTGGATCGPVSYGFSDVVVLTAEPDAGLMFATWAGDCVGQGVCQLDTSKFRADKYVVAVFGEARRTQHENWSNFTRDENGFTIHGKQFLRWIDSLDEPEVVDTFDCAYCHGSAYNGLGIAPSCSQCHANNGHPSWRTECSFCHDAPPPDPHPASAVVAAPPLPGCSNCHPDTVDETGTLVPGGPHMNGKLDGGGHEEGYAVPAVHGRDFFSTAAVTPRNRCQKCHGDDYSAAIVRPEIDGGDARSCNTCHLAAGWQGGAIAGSGWQTNCSFCHGVRDAATQAAPYSVAANPVWSAPPHAIQERLDGIAVPDRTGAHLRHLTTAYTSSLSCGSCHTVPTTLAHISGENERAAMLPQLNYDATGGLGRGLTCATACHGKNPSPAWNLAGPMACDGCHSVPPATPAHLGLTGADLGGECSGCHADTINADGSFNFVAGGHIDGDLDAPPPHAPVLGVVYRTVSVHGARFLDDLAGMVDPQMLKSCNTCHVSYKNCDACHSSATNPAPAISWNQTNWRSNCTFCHGTRTPGYVPGDLVQASPSGTGDTLRMRLESTTVVTTGDQYRIGKHRSHVQQEGGVSDAFPAIACGACHVVPASLNHVGLGPDRHATVTFDVRQAFPGLTEAQYAALPTPFATIAPFTTNPNGTIQHCFGYCHGTDAQTGDAVWGGRASPTGSLAAIRPQWRSSYGNVDCASCHSNPPPTGKQVLQCDADGDGTLELCSNHEWHDIAVNGAGCNACHTPALVPTHVNGVKNVTLGASWDDAAKSCTNIACHTPAGATRTWY
jgi:hypothetical protein